MIASARGVACLWMGALLLGCGGAASTAATMSSSDPADSSMTGSATTASETSGGSSGGTGAGSPGGGSTSTAATGETGGAEDLAPVRGLMHVHSPYSHDACDGAGLEDGKPRPSCLADLRRAACDAELDFMMLTDHPVHMRDYSFEELVLYDESQGDLRVLEGEDVIANYVRCGDGHEVLVTVGFEAPHTMPLGLRQHPGEHAYGPTHDDEPLADAQARVAEIHRVGGIAAVAHSEEGDLSAERIARAGFDAMEWYNPHGNFKAALGGDSITGSPTAVLDLLSGLTPYLEGSSSGANPDLVYLELLPKWPQEGFAKWRLVQNERAVTGILGSDIHQNVSVAPLCPMDPIAGAACRALVDATFPAGLRGLAGGGQLVLRDGLRMDAYARLVRWVENRLFVTELSPNGLHEALLQGKSYGLFSIFGEPLDFSFVTASGELAIGGGGEGAVTLQVDAPSAPGPLGSLVFTSAEAATAEIRTALFKTSGGTSEIIAEAAGLGTRLTAEVSDQGAYHVEVWVTPRHLESSLGTQSSSAAREYLWLITNPFRLN